MISRVNVLGTTESTVAARRVRDGSTQCQVNSDRANVLGFFTLFAGRYVELDALTLVEAFVAIALDAGEMDEHVITLLTRDEAETLFCIEKLHCTLCHETLYSL